MKERKNAFLSIVAILVLFVGVVLGHYFWPVNKVITSTQLRENSSQYKFINPLLLVVNNKIGKAPKYQSITNTLNDYVAKNIAQKNADDISIYFRDLNSGDYSGVRETDLYFPGSMMKVAVMLVCLQSAETNPGFLSKNIIVDRKSINLNVNQFYPPQHQIVPGQTYTVNDLINYMILYSDNNATNLLENLVGDDKINNLLKEIHLPILQNTNTDSDFLSPMLYSRLYRILYNSTYLSPDVSETTLSILAEKDFPQGIYAGIPKTIDVAQKFGEHTSVDQLGNVISHELHDCGIVYLPNDPYFLCVMTKGQDFAKLQPIISDVSKMVWDYFSSNKS